MYMPQLNLNLTQEFSRNLILLMRALKVRTKSEAIRIAVADCLARHVDKSQQRDFTSWLGLAAGGKSMSEWRFKSDDDLWQ